MSRQHNLPNQENCTLEELEAAARAAPIQRTNLRLMAIKALTMGIPHERGIDGLTESPRSGRPPKIKREQGDTYRELIVHPESIDEARRWTGRKFGGYLTSHCQLNFRETLYPGFRPARPDGLLPIVGIKTGTLGRYGWNLTWPRW